MTTSVVQKSVRQYADSLSTQSSVRAVESVQRTVRWGAITGVRKESYHIDPSLCIKCSACKDNCAFDAVYIGSIGGRIWEQLQSMEEE